MEDEEEEALTEQEVKNSSLENIYDAKCLDKVMLIQILIMLIYDVGFLKGLNPLRNPTA